jgi:hypothetical protein
MPANDSIRFAWVDTPDPKRRGFSITIPDAALEEVDLNSYEPNVTTWDQMRTVMRGERVRASLRSYVYTISRQSGGGTRTFYFFPAFTDVQRNTPFRDYPTTIPYTWPAVLEKLAFAEDTSLPQLSKRNGVEVEIPTIIPQVQYRDAYSEDAVARVRMYLSDRPWPEAKLRSEKPVPTSVFWNFQGQQVGSFPECLHPTVNPNLDTYTQFLSPLYGTGTHDGISLNGGFDMNFKIPATNFTDWDNHIVQNRVEINEYNLYIRTEIEVFPPTHRPESIRRFV